jgi:hypothetical protein
MISALLMFRRVARALRFAVREDDFLQVFSAGIALVVIGTISYAMGQDWNIVDALYFAVATLTTTSVSDPDLVLHDAWMKLFTVFYLLIGIGILVEILRRLGFAFLTVTTEEKKGAEPPA